jgi:hypothetical protein
MVQEAVNVWQRITGAAAIDDPSRPEYMDKLAMARWVLYNRFGGTEQDLRNAIADLINAIKLMPADDSSLLPILGIAQLTLFAGTDQEEDLDNAIGTLTAAADHCTIWLALSGAGTSASETTERIWTRRSGAGRPQPTRPPIIRSGPNISQVWLTIYCDDLSTSEIMRILRLPSRRHVPH